MLAYSTQVCSSIGSREKLAVGVQDVVGEFCKYVRVRLAVRMVRHGHFGAAPGTWSSHGHCP